MRKSKKKSTKVGCNDRLMARADLSARQRFENNTKRTADCWLYQRVGRHGYGVFTYRGKWIPAHRVALIWHSEERHVGLFACHRCHNPGCVRPSHLYWGNHDQNMQDMVSSGRSLLLAKRGVQFAHAKLTCAKVKAIWQGYDGKIGYQKKMSEKYKISDTVINDILHRRKWKHITNGLPPRFVALKRPGMTGENHPAAKLNREIVEQIRHEYSTGKLQKAIASDLGVSKHLISLVCRGKRWV